MPAASGAKNGFSNSKAPTTRANYFRLKTLWKFANKCFRNLLFQNAYYEKTSSATFNRIDLGLPETRRKKPGREKQISGRNPPRYLYFSGCPEFGPTPALFNQRQPNLSRNCGLSFCFDPG